MRKSKADSFREAMHKASARTFALRRSSFDRFFCLLCSFAVAALSYVLSDEGDLTPRLVESCLAGVGAYATADCLGAFSPVFLRVSFADMCRLRLPLYSWIAVLTLTVFTASPVRRLFGACDPAAVQGALTLLAVASVVRFFQTGAYMRLALAFAFAGASLGISVVGLLALAGAIVAMRALAGCVLTGEHYDWVDEPHEKIVLYFTNPLVALRMNWIFVFCFLCGVGIAVVAMVGAGALPVGFRPVARAWLGGIDYRGALVFAALMPVAFAVVLCRIGIASDTGERLPATEVLRYVAVAAGGLVLLAKPDLIQRALGRALEIDDRLMAAALIACAYAVLVSMLVILVDIRCRNFRADADVPLMVLKSQMRFMFSVACLVPLAVAALVALLVVHREFDVALFRWRPESAQKAAACERKTSPVEALHDALEQGDQERAETCAKAVLVTAPENVEANLVMGRFCLRRGNPRAAEIYADRICAIATNDVRVLEFALSAYEACGHREKSQGVRALLGGEAAPQNPEGN